MLAIYEKELKSYFTSVIACLFIAVTTFIAGIFFIYYNLTYGYTQMYAAYNALLILVFTIPILTMKIVADERRLKTDQLILTSPISVGKTVVGKFLALVTIYLIPVLIMCVYPLILSRFGEVSFRLAYTNILGLFLYGCAFIAIGVFISSITESQVISAILSIVILFMGYMMNSLENMISSSGNVLTKILGAFDLLSPVDEFMSGVISLFGVVYYLTIIVLFLFLTCQSIQKRRWNVSKATISTGVFSTGFIAVAIVVAVFVNLVAGKVTDKSSWASIDMTASKLYSITDDTKKMLKKINDDVVIYVMAAKDGSDDTIKKTLKNYENSSKHISVEYKDTKLNPYFYADYTDSAPTSNSLIVVNKKTNKSKVVDYNNIYEADTSSYYTTGSTSYTGYDCEGQLDSAISYVLSDKNPVVYQITGHDEIGMGSKFSDAISKMNCDVEEIKLASMDSLSVDDCEMIMILGPTKDYSKDETQKVIDYLNAGGKAIIACETYKSAQTDKPNFESILEAFGVKVVEGVIAENDTDFYSNQYGPFFTFANGSGSFASGIDNYIIAPYAKGLQQVNKDDSSITYTSLATTSKAVSKTHLKSAKKYTKEDGDVEGTFDLGAQIKKSVTSENENGESTTTETNILALSSVYMLDDNMNELVADANLEMFNNALSEYINTDDSVETLSIPSKSLQASQLTITASVSRLVGIIVAVVLPIAILVAGIVIWTRRRKR